MGYRIDTNVWSELQKGKRANAGVRRWYASVEPEALHVSVLVVGEVRRGIERLRRRDPQQAERLEQRLEALKVAMGDRILPISAAIAERWGTLGVPDPLLHYLVGMPVKRPPADEKPRAQLRCRCCAAPMRIVRTGMPPRPQSSASPPPLAAAEAPVM
ncbi:PIN domain-containing protein [Halochromatium glycolicum]|uniref:PIN domain-containing protein n=1 Tax=Halochromatium glycolicum TaxID=85075 RepID=A0AAJ0U895_9GAMM|nr:PIN domain-containing protein [Halochromatium glycolicum]MBK1707081.1 hypothetical protein [Halochromatium glycolicum]